MYRKQWTEVLCHTWILYIYIVSVQSTVRCKTIAISNPKPGHKVSCNQLWEFHFVLVGINKVQALGYNAVSRVMWFCLHTVKIHPFQNTNTIITVLHLLLITLKSSVFWLCVKTGFTLEVTPRKSRVDGGWDLASPYVVCPGLHAQWSCISGLVGGGDKNLSWDVNKPVGVWLSRLSE